MGSHAKRVQVSKIQMSPGETEVRSNLQERCVSVPQVLVVDGSCDEPLTAGDEYEAVERNCAAPNIGR